jgi:hypothetical protein
LILQADKRVENRGWRTAYTGPLWVHAGKTWDDEALPFAAFMSMVSPEPVSPNPDDHPTGIVGIVTLAGAVRDSRSPWATPGQWHWLLDDPQVLAEAVPCRGGRRLWYPPPDVAARAAELAALEEGR